MSSPANIQRLPKAIHAQERALANGRLPNMPGSMASSIPTGRENTQPHFGRGVCPFAKAFICVNYKTAKNIQNIMNAGRTK